MEIRTILCPVDFSDRSTAELALAGHVARRFGARLVVHHNQGGAIPGLARAWDWESTAHRHADTESTVEAKLNALLSTLPSDLEVEARLSSGLVAPTLLYLAEQLPADLIVLGVHGTVTEEHESVGDRIISQAPCPVLTIREGCEGRACFEGDAPLRILVPSDLSPDSEGAVQYAFSFSRHFDVRMELFHVVSPAVAGLGIAPYDHVPIMGFDQLPAIEAAEARLRTLVPEDLVPRVECSVGVGYPADQIVDRARTIGADLVFMGEHATGFFRRLFTHDTARDLLHRASCPVWFVPPTVHFPAHAEG